MNKSNFAKYLLYKFKSHIGIFAASIVLTLLGFALSVTLISVFTSNAADYYHATDGMVTYLPQWLFEFSMAMVIYGLPGLGISALGLFALSAITPILSFKFYNNRAFTDVIGSLPLNYTERFFGDFLSGFAAVCLPYLVFVPYVLIMSGYIGSLGIEQFADLPANFSQGALELGLIIVSTYTFSSLIVSLCGKISSSVFYTMAGIAMVPGIIFVYVLSSLSDLVGVRADVMAISMIQWIPPVGLIPDFAYFWGEYYAGMFYHTDHLIEVETYEYVIAAVLTVAYAVGAYFIGKHRKTESIGKDVVYQKVFSVFAVLLEAVAIGVVFCMSAGVDHLTFIFAALLGILCFIIIDLVHTKNAKRLPKDLICCAAVCTVCLVFSGVANSTKGFGAEDYLPAAEDVSYIEVRGSTAYFSESKVFVYDDPGAIEQVISEHKELLSQKDKLETGLGLEINYKLKNGMSVLRSYEVKESEYKAIILRAVNHILSLTQKGEYPFGVLSMKSGEYSDLSFTGMLNYDEQIDNEHYFRISEEYMIDPEKTEEFKELMLNAMKNIVPDTTDHYDLVFAYYTKDGIRQSEMFYIIYEYEDVYNFIKDPDNRITINDCRTDPALSENEEVVIKYSFSIKLKLPDGGEEYLQLKISSDSDDPDVAELISLCSIDFTDCTYLIEAKRISPNYGDVFINKKDESRATELILNLMEKSIASEE